MWFDTSAGSVQAELTTNGHSGFKKTGLITNIGVHFQPFMLENARQ
jgi:hypothetical protein